MIGNLEATIPDAQSEGTGIDREVGSTAERCVAFCRGVVFLTTLVMVEGETLAGLRPPGALDLLVLAAGIYVLGTSILAMLGRETPNTQFPLLVADMLMITGVIYLAEGVRSEYYLLYYMPILQASVRLQFRDAVASALLSSGLYGLVALTSGPNVLVPISAQLRAATFAGSAVFMAVFFALLSREARVHLKRSREMTDLAGALAAKNSELEERTRELAEAQESLLAAGRLATIGELAASVGHELRNPLGVIRNAAYYLRQSGLAESDDAREMIDLMDAEVGTCDRTIAALLDFARPEQAAPEPTDVNSVVGRVLDRTAVPEGLAVDVDLADGLPLAEADPHQLEQVFNNIAGNAFQAMSGDGTGILKVRSSVEDGGVCVRWEDDGPGISAENLAKIFDPLFTTKAKGIGLGLVVCRRLVERQGGILEVTSEVGEGAVFAVHLREAEGGPEHA